MNRLIYWASIFAGLWILAACSDGPDRDVEYTIYSTHSSIELLEGEEFQIVASPTTQTFTWESTDPAVATVSATGLVRAISDGTCFINITSSEGLKRAIPVDVEKLLLLEGFEVFDKSNLATVSSISLLAGRIMELGTSALPSNYNEKVSFTVKWESSDEDIVTVDGNGKVTPVYFGSAEITASVVDKPSLRKVIPVTVLENPRFIERTDWKIIEWNSCISEESQYASLNRTPEKMLDGNVATFWGSKWDAPKPLPYYFIFDMKRAYKIYRIIITKPNDSWRGNFKNGYFEISDDNITWRKLSDWSVSSNEPREHTFDQDGSSARYLRFVISEAFEYDNESTDPASGARCDIAEFNVFGDY